MEVAAFVIDQEQDVRVAIVNESLQEGMGYAGLAIPKTMKKMGVDVHYVTAGLPVYHTMKDYKAVYGNFHKNRDQPGTSRIIEGYPVHVIDFSMGFGGARLIGLKEKLAELKPDIVQTFGHVTWPALQSALYQKELGYRLFTGNHTTASVYPLAQRKRQSMFDALLWKETLIRKLPGMAISSRIEACYGATNDCADVAHRFMGVPQDKLKMLPLGVETDIFHPAIDDEERAAATRLRRELGVGDDEIMVVYTGRFTEDKNPLLLAQAIDKLRSSGQPYRAVFFGEGPQRAQIADFDHAIVREFVHYTKLADLYRAADIGVWPTQESTSMLDCAASGTPIIVNDTIVATERAEGNGLFYRLNDVNDLVTKLRILKDPIERHRLGSHGARKIEREFSWRSLVQKRLDDYEAALAADQSA